MSNHRNMFVFIIFVFVIAGCSDEPRITDETLAVIGERVIEAEDFVARYREFRRQTGEGVPDTYDARREVLKLYVDEELLITEAEKRRLAEDAEGQHERQRLETQELLNLFSRTFIAPAVTVSDAELKALFVRLNTRIKARHLYAPTKKQADSLYALVQNGASFEQLAKQIFQDEQLRSSGGSLGYFSVDEMEPGFENTAFRLQEGEVSPPVKTSDGYSIIRVDDRVTRPIVTENEYAKHKHKLHTYWKNRKLKAAMQTFSDSLAHSLNISFREPVLAELYAAFAARQSNSRHEAQWRGADDLSDMKLLSSDIGEWTVGDFHRRARFTSSEHHARIRNKSQFREFVTGLVVREKMLLLAKEAGLDERPQYRENVAQKWDAYLLTRMEQLLEEQMTVPEDSVRNYYEEYSEKFMHPPAINLREIVLRSEQQAKRVQEELRQGGPFQELARKYSVRDWSASKGGELGFLTPADFGRWADTVFAMQAGEQKGPIAMDSMFVFLECIAKKPARIKEYEQVRPEVEAAVRYAMHDAYRRQRIEEIKQNIDRISVMADRLKEIKIRQ